MVRTFARDSLKIPRGDPLAFVHDTEATDARPESGGIQSPLDVPADDVERDEGARGAGRLFGHCQWLLTQKFLIFHKIFTFYPLFS